MISKGSCDTEDWSKDAENSALPSQELITFLNIFKYKTVILICNSIPKHVDQIVFDQINAALMTMKLSSWKNRTDTKHLTSCNIYIYIFLN